MKIIKAENIKFSYPEKKAKKVLEDVSFEIEKGEFVAVLGKNDSGKTSLLKLVNALLPVQGGKLTVCGFDISYENNIPAVRRRCAMVFPEADRRFVCDTVDEEIAYSLRNFNITCTAEKLAAAKRRAGLHVNGGVRISSLNLLQKFCLSLAAAIVIEPEILLLDAVFCELGYNDRQRFMSLISALNRDGMTIVLTTYDAELASRAQRVILLSGGRILADGKMREILENRELLGHAGVSLSFAMKCWYDLLEADIKLESMPFTIEELVKEVCR